MCNVIRQHIRPWSVNQVLVFLLVFGVMIVILTRKVNQKKLQTAKAIGIGLLFTYMVMVFASTVFTRTPTSERHYQLIPFWSWKAAVLGQEGMREEVLLNILLFIPIGILLAYLGGKKNYLAHALIFGLGFSIFIEVCQLMFYRGLFEWDDMIGNSLGTWVGCMVFYKFRR